MPTVHLCDKCNAQVDFENGTSVKHKFCSPGFGSKFDCDSERYYIDLPDGVYCYTCLDAILEAFKPTHVCPQMRDEHLDRLLNCQCDVHSGIRKTGGKQLLRAFQILSGYADRYEIDDRYDPGFVADGDDRGF